MEAATIVRYRPSHLSATNPPSNGSIDAVADHTLTSAAAVAVVFPSGPLIYVIRFDAIP